jgi:hypothetical protein
MPRTQLWPEVRVGLEILLRELPLSRKLRAVHLCDEIIYDGEECRGLTEIHDGEFVLCFERAMSAREAQEALVHEYAHARTEDKIHTKRWGGEYAMALRILLGE